MHCDRREAVAFLEALQPEFKAVPAAGREERASTSRASLQARGTPHRLGGTDNHLFLLDLIDRTSRARMRTRRSAAPTSRSTRTPCPTIRARRW
jgi:glycine/serine hydroxymethyltransferase